jgi:hypothetical protein
MKVFISFFCFGLTLALANEAYQSQAAIDSVAESINSQKGIEIGGTVRGISYKSNFSSEQEKLNSAGRAQNTLPDVEVAEFVQLDLNFLFRPWDNISANLKLRLGAGMQEYFAAAATNISAPWLSIQGNAANGKFHWIVGDYRQQYSPLTLYAPGVDILYEPAIFALKREIAMGDALLEGNKRNLQGFNLQFRPSFSEADELRVEALGARLRRAGYLDEGGAMGNILPNEDIPGSSQAGNFDKFLLGGNLEYLLLNKNVLVGGSYLVVLDEENSALKHNGNFVNKNDTLPQNTQVFAGRLGFDLAEILKMPNLVANAMVEYANSNDKIYNPEIDGGGNVTGFVSEPLKGSALLASLDIGYKSSFKVVLSGNFINNALDWFNPLAQSSQFNARRILNSDKDGDLSKYGVYAPLYSTFDALYNFTPKHSPVVRGLNNPQYVEEYPSYHVFPYVKSSWSAATFTRAELALLDELIDANLQTALPGGLATANRTGATGTLAFGYGDYIEAKGLFTSLKQSSAISGTEASYTEFGGGAKIDALGLAGFENNPLEVSGSYKHSLKEQDALEFKSDFINAGLYYRFFKRFALSAGYQRIESDLNSTGVASQKATAAALGLGVNIVPIEKSIQDQWMVGLNYTVARHAWLSISYGIANVENTYSLEGSESVVNSTTGAVNPNKTNLPDYFAALTVEPDAKKIEHKFSRNVLEAAINVEF